MFHPIKCTIDSMFHMLLDITDVNNTMIPRDSQRWDPRFPKIPEDPQTPSDPPEIPQTSRVHSSQRGGPKKKWPHPLSRAPKSIKILYLEPPGSGSLEIFVWNLTAALISLFGGSPSFKLFIWKFSELRIFNLINPASIFFSWVFFTIVESDNILQRIRKFPLFYY
jgi:hypothetical protein